MEVKKFHRLNEDFDIIDINNVNVNKKKDEYDQISFKGKDIVNGNIIVVDNIPYIVRDTILSDGGNDYTGEEFLSRAKDSVPWMFAVKNKTAGSGINYLLSNTFSYYNFPDRDTVLLTIEGELYNCHDLFNYLRDELDYTINCTYQITNDYIFTTVNIVKETNLNNTEVILDSDEYICNITIDSNVLATALYPKLDTSDAVIGWGILSVEAGTQLRYWDEQGLETGDPIISQFTKDNGSYYIYYLDYDQNDFCDYGLNNHLNTSPTNILRYVEVDVDQTHPVNILLDLQKEFIKIMESSVKIDVQIYTKLDLKIGDVLILDLDQPTNLLSVGEDVSRISVKIIGKDIMYIDENETNVSYTTSDSGTDLGLLLDGKLTSVKNLITKRS